MDVPTWLEHGIGEEIRASSLPSLTVWITTGIWVLLTVAGLLLALCKYCRSSFLLLLERIEESKTGLFMQLALVLNGTGAIAVAIAKYVAGTT